MNRNALAGALFAAAVLASPAAAKIPVRRLASELRASGVPDQIRIAGQLGASGSSEAVEPLLSAFDVRRGNPRLSAAIVRALGRLRDKRAYGPLLAAWDYLDSLRLNAEEPPPHLQALRADLAEALSLLGDRGAAPALQRALDDRDSVVAEQAARGLGRLKERRAVDSLVALLPRGGNLAQAAYEALGEIADARAVPAVSRGLAQEDALTQSQAAYALARMEPSGPGLRRLEKLAADERLEAASRVMAAYYLLKLDKKAGLEVLGATLDEGEAGAKRLAAEALGKSGSPKAVKPLARALGSDDPSVRALAASSLGRLGGGRALSSLRRAADDPNPTVRGAVRAALADLGEAD